MADWNVWKRRLGAMVRVQVRTWRSRSDRHWTWARPLVAKCIYGCLASSPLSSLYKQLLDLLTSCLKDSSLSRLAIHIHIHIHNHIVSYHTHPTLLYTTSNLSSILKTTQLLPTTNHPPPSHSPESLLHHPKQTPNTYQQCLPPAPSSACPPTSWSKSSPPQKTLS